MPQRSRSWTTTEVIQMEDDKLPPVHPGEVLREEFLKPLGLSQNRLALDIGVGHSHNLGQLPSCGLPETTGSGEGWRLDAGEEPGEQIVGLLAEEALSGGGAVRAPGVVVV